MSRAMEMLSVTLQVTAARLDLLTPRWAYVGRSMAAAALAYGVAYSLQLDKPYSAASTVMLVANLNHGVVLAKGGWRLGGTLIGGLASIVVMGLFIQAPLLFLLAFGAWLGVCAAAATLLRHFRATGAAVAGYTMGFATYGALEAPDHALSIVLARVATVAIGVACLGVVTAVFSRRATPAKLDAALAGRLVQTGRFLIARLKATPQQPAPEGDELVAGLFEIDDLAEVAGAECATAASRAAVVRHGLVSMFGVVLAGRELGPDQPDLSAPVRAAREAIVERLPAILDAVAQDPGRKVGAALAHAAALEALVQSHAVAAERDCAVPDALIELDVLVEAVQDLTGGLVGLSGLRGGPAPSPGRLRYHRDWHGAGLNGVRAMLGIVLCGWLGMAVGWQGWTLTLLLLAPYGVLMAMTAKPVAGAWSFVRGTVLAAPVAFVCAFLVLPGIDGFPLLILAMAPAWAAGFYATTFPRWAFDGMGFLVAFNTLVLAANPIRYDAPLFFNEAFSWIVAVVATVLVLVLILPHAPRRQADRIARAIRADLVKAIAGRMRCGRGPWEHLQHHRMALIARALPGDAAYGRTLTHQAMGGLHLARLAIRVRQIGASHGSPSSLATEVQAALTVAASFRPEAARRLAGSAIRIAHNAEQLGDRSHRVAADLRGMAALMDAHQGWLNDGKVRP